MAWPQYKLARDMHLENMSGRVYGVVPKGTLVSVQRPFLCAWSIIHVKEGEHKGDGQHELVSEDLLQDYDYKNPRLT